MPLVVIQAPVSLLQDPRFTPAAKLLWLAARAGAVGPTKLAAATGLTARTAKRARAQLAATPDPATGAQGTVPVPAALLAEPLVRPQAKLLYGLLQTLPGRKGDTVVTTYQAVSDHTCISPTTARAAIRQLAATGWLNVKQASRKAPVHITMTHLPPKKPPMRPQTRLDLVRRRLEESQYDGESIMHEYLSLLIDSDEYEENARPGFLINPITDERLELDRYYPQLQVAFEFHGLHHFQTTERFPSVAALAALQARDLMTEAHCARRGIRLEIIRWRDLTLQTMQQKVGNTLPLRDLTRHRSILRFLQKTRPPRP